MQITYIGHSGISLRTPTAAMVWDYYTGQITYRQIAGTVYTTRCGSLQAGYYLEHGSLSGTVFADKCNTVALIDNVCNIVKERITAKFYR